MSILACRLRCGFSQAMVAAELGCSSTTINRWDHGKTPSWYNINRLCDLLGVSAETLMREEPSPAPNMQTLLRIVKQTGTDAFCKKTGVTKLTIRNWRHGATVNPSTLRHIAQTLEIRTEVFFEVTS